MYSAQVRIVDSQGNHLAAGQTGGIVVESNYMMEGYWNDTALTREDKARRPDSYGRLGSLR